MVEKITASELRARKDEFVIIDVREADEIANGQIASINYHTPFIAFI